MKGKQTRTSANNARQPAVKSKRTLKKLKRRIPPSKVERVEKGKKGDPLRFLSGAFFYRSHREPLTRKPWQVLKALAEAPDRTLSLRDLLGEVWGNTVIGEEAVRRHVYTARQALRRAMRTAHVTPPDDPIYAVDRGTNRCPFAAIAQGSIAGLWVPMRVRGRGF